MPSVSCASPAESARRRHHQPSRCPVLCPSLPPASAHSVGLVGAGNRSDASRICLIQILGASTHVSALGLSVLLGAIFWTLVDINHVFIQIVRVGGLKVRTPQPCVFGRQLLLASY